MMREIKRIDVVSALKVSGILYALLGLIFALLFLPFMGVMSSFASAAGEDAGMFPMMFGGGISMILIMPIMYGIMGAIFGALGALIYNLVSKWVGGIKVVVDDVDDLYS